MAACPQRPVNPVPDLMDIIIRPAEHRDAEGIARIYNHYILNTHITFETETLAAPEVAERITQTLAIPLPWLVAEASGSVVGYALAAPWKARSAYRFSVESTVYLDPMYFRKGLGLQLYSALIDSVRDHSMHVALGTIALPNENSIGLHEHMGFTKVGHFEQVGYKLGRWVDVGYWQLVL